MRRHWEATFLFNPSGRMESRQYARHDTQPSAGGSGVALLRLAGLPTVNRPTTQNTEKVLARRNAISREDILDAAEQVIAEDGAGRLTLEAVAARAQVSKGGLQYIFKSKDALIQAMIKRFMEKGERDFEVESQRLGDPRRNLQAYVSSGFSAVGAVQPVHSALMAAAASNPELLVPLRGLFAANMERLVEDTGLPFGRVAAVALAADALLLLGVIGVNPLTASQRQDLLEELQRLAQPSAV